MPISMKTIKTSLRLPEDEYRYLQKYAKEIKLPASYIISVLIMEHVSELKKGNRYQYIRRVLERDLYTEAEMLDRIKEA